MGFGTASLYGGKARVVEENKQSSTTYSSSTDKDSVSPETGSTSPGVNDGAVEQSRLTSLPLLKKVLMMSPQ